MTVNIKADVYKRQMVSTVVRSTIEHLLNNCRLLCLVQMASAAVFTHTGCSNHHPGQKLAVMKTLIDRALWMCELHLVGDKVKHLDTARCV